MAEDTEEIVTSGRYATAQCRLSRLMVLLIVSLSILLETIEQTFFTLSGRRPSQSVQWLSCGIGTHILAIGIWFWLLTLLPLGIAMPLMGTSYATIALVSKWLFNEPVDRWRWLGIMLIVSGLVLIGGAIDR